MPTDFNFSIEELIRNPSSNIARQITASGRLSTSRHQRGDRNVLNLNMHNLSEIIMRMPAFRPLENVLSLHESALSGSIGALLQRVPETFQNLIPGDILGRADSLGLEPRQLEGGAGGGTPGGGIIPGLVEPPSDLAWRAGDRLQPNTHAARDFIRRTWGDVLSIGGFRASGGGDHPRGLALDVMVANGAFPSDHMKNVGTSVARWFIANPNVFGTKYVIWWGAINSAARSGGWREYTSSQYNVTQPTGGHYDHPHISFNPRSSRGSMGGAWEGTDMISNHGVRGPMGGVPGVPQSTPTFERE